jgi:hypothetical protein
MKKKLLLVFILLTGLGMSQDEEMVSIPKSKLTDQQKAELKIESTQSWVGMGKEIGEAVNSSMAAITAQSNNFAQTPVGKLTVFIVIWKVVGDQVIHVAGGLIEVLVFVPIWIWSYRRTCMTRSIRTGKDTWERIEYTARGDMTPRIAHALIGLACMGAIALTVFSY